MKLYRASQTEEIFPGAHFSDSFAEAEAYSLNSMAGTGKNFGAPVREYDVDGRVLQLDSIADAIEWAVEEMQEGNDIGQLGDILDRFVPDGAEPKHMNQADADYALKLKGYYYTFDMLEQIDGMIDAIKSAGYDWVKFNEPSVGNSSEVCTTYRKI